MAEMDRTVSQSFVKVKQDTDTLYQWVTYLHAQNQQLVEQYYSFDPILQRIKHIEQKIELLEMRRERSSFRPLDHSTPSVSPPARETASTALKEKMMRKLARNSKDYIKNLVLGLVHKYGKMGALQLREMVVDEQGLCSKSSFYRILEEMENEHSLQVVSDGKHTVYIASATHATA